MFDDEQDSTSGPELPKLSEENRSYLKTVARDSVVNYVKGMRAKPLVYSDPALKGHYGAFVTYKIHGDLRGCIGMLTSDMPLPETIADTAIRSAVNDPRFPPVGPNEVDKLDIEISIMGHMREVKNINEIKIGRDGLVIEHYHRHGLLLPQVATEHGLDVESFLAQTCLKAGVPMDSWKHGAKIYRFAAEVF
jgi:AmmeMemoRadiSam system protein A